MKGKKRYGKVAKEFAQRKESKSIIFSGSLGVTTGGKNVVDVAGRPGFVWVFLRNQLNELVQAFNESVSPVFNLPVQVEWDADHACLNIPGRPMRKQSRTQIAISQGRVNLLPFIPAKSPHVIFHAK